MPDNTFTQAQVDEAVDKARAPVQAELDKAKGELLDAQSKVKDIETALATKTTEAETLTASIATLTTERDTLKAEVDPLKVSLGSALGKYRDLAVSANPNVPAELVKGASIEEMSQSVEAGIAMVAKIREAMSKQLAQTPVPPGAPPRTSGVPGLEEMSPIEKIKYGIAHPPKA